MDSSLFGQLSINDGDWVIEVVIDFRIDKVLIGLI